MFVQIQRGKGRKERLNLDSFFLAVFAYFIAAYRGFCCSSSQNKKAKERKEEEERNTCKDAVILRITLRSEVGPVSSSTPLAVIPHD